MAIQLVKLRYVPDDERLELYALLDENAIEYYETSAGNWGMSMPAIWIRNDEQEEQAKALLEEYSEQRYITAREKFEYNRANGSERGFLDIIKDNPLQFVVYLVLIVGLVCISIIPFLSLSD